MRLAKQQQTASMVFGVCGRAAPFFSNETTAACGGAKPELAKMRSAKDTSAVWHEVDAGFWNPSPLSRGSSASKSLVLFWFSFDSKRELSPNAKALYPAPQAQKS